MLASLVRRPDSTSPLPPSATMRIASSRRRHSISTSTLQCKPPTITMSDHTFAPQLSRPSLRPPTVSTLTLPMPTPSRPPSTTRKMVSDLRRHSFRIPSVNATTPPKPVAAAARPPVKVLTTASSAVRIHTSPRLKSVPATPASTSSSAYELPILRYQYVARDVRVSIGSAWRLPRAERKNIRLTTTGAPEPFLTVFCSETTTKFALPADTVVELNNDQLKIKSASDSAMRLKLRFATAADASIWRRLVTDALAQAAWRRDYEDVACLAQNAVSRVLVARRIHAKTECVVKTHLLTRVEDVPEVAVLRKLVPLAATHAPLAFLKAYRVVETAQDVQLIMPRHAGETLLAYLSRSEPTKALREPEARRILAHMCEALHVLHTNGIVHCDLKLENVLVSDHDVCVIDFGGAYDRNAPVRGTTTMVGTPGYIAPERVLHVDEAPTPAADLFSLGILMYQMLAGQHPFAQAKAARRRLTIEDSLSLDWSHMAARLSERNVSLEAQELLAQLVAADPRERITLEQVFNHAWFTNQSA